MKLVNYFPVRKHNMPNVFDSFEEMFSDMPPFFKGNMLTTPSVNISEFDHEYKIELAAPGLEKGDFEVKVDHDLLTISVHKEELKEEKGKYTRKEFGYFEFSRTFTLPDSVDASKIVASYDSGILNVALPKKPEAQPQPAKTIKVG